mgnify:CR=1 FL=1
MSKGGTTSQSTQIPAYLEDAVRENINRARDVSQIGYVPYYGPDVAAFSPMQQQSMRSTGNAASAFGLAPQGFDGTAGIPQAQTFAGGVQGYSSAPLYEQSLDNLFANAPAQYNAMADMFIDPFTGARSRNNYGNASPVAMTGGGNGNSPYGNDANIAHLNRTGAFGRDGNNDGEYFGVNSEYNPYKYSMPTKDISGDGVIDYRDMSFGEAGRRDIGFGENVGNFLKSATGIGTIESLFDYGEGLADGFTPNPEDGLFSQIMKSSMTPEESMRIINEGAARGEAKYAREEADRLNRIARQTAGEFSDQYYDQNQLALDYAQRGDMYLPDSTAVPAILPPDFYNDAVALDNVSGGLLNGTALDRARLELTPAADGSYSLQQQASIDQANARVAQINADRIAREQAAAQEAAIEAARAAAAEQARIAAAQRSTVNGGGGGQGASQRATTGGQSRGTVGSGNGNAIRSGNGNAIRFGR